MSERRRQPSYIFFPTSSSHIHLGAARTEKGKERRGGEKKVKKKYYTLKQEEISRTKHDMKLKLAYLGLLFLIVKGKFLKNCCAFEL